MKVKFTLQRPAGAVDLVATVDSATTVGDLAAHLAAADPHRAPSASADGDLTITVVGAESLSVDPRLPVVDSGLHSGAVVSIGRVGGAYGDPHRAAAAVVKILDGPDAGREYQIPVGASVIGRERGCDVRLTDTMVSRRHARINVSDVVEIIDLGSANGVLIDDTAAPRSILRGSDVVQLGDTRLSVRRLATPTGPAAPSGGHEFVRSPRLDPVYEGQRFEAPELPERGRNQRFPLIPMLAPLLMGGLLYLITKSLTSIVFVALSPIMLIGNVVESRVGGRSDYKKAVKAFWEDVDALVEELQSATTAEVTSRRGEHPDTAAAVAAAQARSPLLWTRRPGARGFADICLGHGRLPSRHELELPSTKRSTRALYRELVAKVDPFATVDGVPVVASLAHAALGLAGPRSQVLPVARAVVAQLVALHSPAELVVTAMTSPTTAADWDWLKWLPHTSSPSSPLTARPLSSSATTSNELVAELEELLASRRDADYAPVGPAVVVVVETDAVLQHSRVAALARDGAAHGIHVVWLADEVAALPAACETFVEVGRTGVEGVAGFVHTGTAVEPVTLEHLTGEAAAAMARQLSPVVDLDAQVDDASDLPRAVSLLTLTGTELASSPHAVIERWTENRSVLTGPFAPARPVRHAGTLRAVIGQSAGEAHALDLRADGPHALVGGTTGAGKSELLQAWILAMAAAHSPQRLTFLLVDYKGGAAFKDCKDLPHTVGLVTDLSPHLVRRALASLSAELRHREKVLHRHGAKDLVELEKKGVVDAPPSLVLVVDEFAALVSEVPEFVDGVVNVAQRGRSLGLHLILATQRPAGVIKDNLRANTNLRLALRMADESDSSDVLGSPEAAFFDPTLPGRAVSKTGPGRLVPFQTGYAGGWTTDEPPAPDIVVEELGFGTPAVWRKPEVDEVVAENLGPTDIERLVGTIGAAGALAEIPAPRKPWLPELGRAYDLADQTQVRSRRTDTELVFGLADVPDDQVQSTVAFEPDRHGNLAIFGAGGSGKSALLRSLAVAAGFTVRGGPCHVYGIDFGRALTMLEDLPHVGSVISGADHERITRLLGWLRGLVDERQLRYARANAATITDYRTLAGAPDEPRILLLVDGVAAFRSAYEPPDRLRWFDLFTSIASDGRPVGVHVVLTSDQRGGLSSALASAMQSRVVLRMSNADDYSFLGVPADVLSPASPAGRGIMDEREIQVAVLGGTPDVVKQAAALRGFAESMRRSGASTAAPIRALPERIPLRELPATLDDQPVIGIASSTLAPIAFAPSGPMVLCGPPGSGRTTVLQAFAEAVHRWRPDAELYYFGSARSPLAALPFWKATSLNPQTAGDLATDLTAGLAGRAATAPPLAVFIEGAAEHASGMGDFALEQLVKQCATDGHLVIGEGETSTFNSSMGLVGQLKTGRAGLALSPDLGDGSTIFKTNFPRLGAIDLLPGRGVLVRLGRTEIVQVGLPS
ncbi:MAG: FtsK/SpoIIIE domain-containing protein [Jatrophihabitans sp.]|uniref:FtsK/SpoIIIE domain-containing protein n=1 Tax=Jatrophihabitans sp. TaxID=1932789 RepID=UPI003F81C221